MRRVWAVARGTFIEGVRSQVTVVFIVALAAAAVIVPMVSAGVSLRYQIQTFLAYSIGVNAAGLGIMTILLTCGMICREVDKRHIFSPMTKPIPRWQYLVGRWAGVVLLQTVLLTAAAATAYATVRVMRYEGALATRQGSVADRKVAQYELEQVDNEIFVARTRHRPMDVAPRIQAIAAELIDRRSRIGAYQRGVELDGQEDTDKAIYKEAKAKVEGVAPGGSLKWRFESLPLPSGPDETLQLEMKIKAANALPLEELKRVVIFTNPDTGESRYRPFLFPADRTCTIVAPASLISADGVLEVEFVNKLLADRVSPIASSITIAADEIFLLYRVGRFEGNFIRAVMLKGVVLAFLAAMSVLASSFLSFPVACLWCFILYLIGLMSSFLQLSTQSYGGPEVVWWFGRIASSILFWLLPDFSKVAAADNLVDGVLISWSQVFEGAGVFIGVWCVIMLAMAGVIFTRRELARVVA